MRRTLFLAALILLAGCARSGAPVEASGLEEPRRIYLVSHGWHTGIAVATADLPSNWPLQDFRRARYLEIGWGDAAFYRADEATIWLALRALLWPSPSVLHIAAVEGDISTAFPASTIVQVDLARSDFERLHGFIVDEFQLDPDGRPIPAGRGLYGESGFYHARSKFYFPRTCNYWVASTLHAAGVPITPALAITAGALIAQVARHGTVIQRADEQWAPELATHRAKRAHIEGH